MSILLFVTANAAIHCAAVAKAVVVGAKVASAIGVGMLYDHIVLGD